MSTQPAIRLEGASKRYGEIAAVRAVSFALAGGEIAALVGHNGAGKTTLLKLILGLVRADAGTIRVLDEDPGQGAFAARRRIGFLPEAIAFNPALTGEEILRFYARLKGVRRDAIAPLLEQVGIAGAARRRIGTYSKGMRQRLGLAQALLGNPRILLLDEPTTGLDPELRLGFYDALTRLRESGVAIVLCSHALTELEQRADRVLIMDRGALVADGGIDALRDLAHLPTRLRVRVAAHGHPAALAAWRHTGPGVFEIDAAGAEKLALLRRALALAGIADVEIVAPSLDALYAHFLRARPAAS